MSGTALIVLIATFFGWGLSTFIAKLATNRIGMASAFWQILSEFIVMAGFCLLTIKSTNIFQVDKVGILWALLGGAFGGIGFIGFFYLVSKSDASTMVPLTALYPALAVILGIVVLHEGVTVNKVIGIVLSLVAIYLLNK